MSQDPSAPGGDSAPAEPPSPADELLAAPLYGLTQGDKDARLTAALAALTRHHRAHCPAYRRITDVLAGGERPYQRVADVPWLPVGLFKSHRLVSVPDDEITTTLTSSGTTGQRPSKIYLDRHTAARQSKALARIMSELLGPRRLPMMVVDTRAVLDDRTAFSARGAGVLGMMTFGSQPLFVLDRDLQLDLPAVEEFLRKHGDAPFLVFGFTYMVWSYFYQPLAERGLDLSRGILVHSGGWKKLVEQSVDNPTFKARLGAATGLRRIHNFYGMVEQIGSVFVEGEDGLLYPPAFADVVIRDPMTFEEMPTGKAGVVQTVSALPTSYPGHSLLTEDLGVVERVDIDVCGRLGKAIRIIGRAPRAELRGCSDTHAAEVGA
ncbi:MAG TPA: hypothetical protein VHE35_12655 [Kofleriaceae bacterium]|nr:hypothetical protein [Kofleriaceae bacterium]